MSYICGLSGWGGEASNITCTRFNPQAHQKIQCEPVFLLQCCFSLNVTKQKRGEMIPGRQMPD